MASTTSSAPSSIDAGGFIGKGKRNEAVSSSPSEETGNFPTPTVTYNAPPASWFFSRGTKDNPNKTGEQNISETNAQQAVSPPKRKGHSSIKTSTSPNRRNSNTNTDFGMVSDNDEEDECEGFNFVAISNSLLMAGNSYEGNARGNESSKEDADAHSHFGAGSDKHRGVLIMDGVDISLDGAQDTSMNANPADTSVLTIPGSDSLPSEIGSIGHNDDDEDHLLDGALEQENQDQPGAMEENHSQNYPPMVHRFLKNLQRNRRTRLVSDASDENAGVSVVGNDEEGSTAWYDDFSMAWSVGSREDRFGFKSFLRGRNLTKVLAVSAMAIALACVSFVVSQRNHWEQRLQQEAEAMARLMAEKESLRQEVELLMEEATIATARADSLAREQERLILQKQEAERAEKERIRMLQEKEQRKQKERRNQKRRKEQPWRSTSNDDDGFEWFFDDSNEECSGRRGDSTSFTIVDNCWFKAKADINLGSCGGETKDYFSSIWNGLWQDWEYYFDEPTAVNAYPVGSSSDGQSGEQYSDSNSINDYYQLESGDEKQDREGAYSNQDRGYQYGDDTYYPPQDPLRDVFSVIHSAGQSFVNKLSNLMNDEVEAAETAAREMDEIARRKYAEASKTVADAMVVAKEDIRDLSQEALLALRTAVQKSNSNNYQKTDEKGSPSSANAKEGASPSPPTQEVTRKALFDAATAVTSLSKSWQVYAKSLSVSGEAVEE